MIDTISMILGFAINITIIVAFIMSLFVIKKIGKGIINLAVVPMSIGIFIIGVSNLFIFLAESEFYSLSTTSFHIWWHLIVNIGFLSIIFGGMRIQAALSDSAPLPFGKKDKLVLGIFLGIVVCIFIVAPSLESIFSKALDGSVIERYGLHHLTTILLAFIAGIYLFSIKKQAGSFVISIPFIVGFLFLLGGQHIWELLTESLKIISIDHEKIELVEQFMVMPAMLLFALSQWKILKHIRG